MLYWMMSILSLESHQVTSMLKGQDAQDYIAQLYSIKSNTTVQKFGVSRYMFKTIKSMLLF